MEMDCTGLGQEMAFGPTWIETGVGLQKFVFFSFSNLIQSLSSNQKGF
jgi:hypothetical protein